MVNYIPADGAWQETHTPSAQVVAESLIEYAQKKYEANKIGWDAYSRHAVDVLNALCGNVATPDAEASNG